MAINRIPYHISLRVLGQLLNGDKARMVTLCEIDQGFLLHYFVKGDPNQVQSRAIHGAEVLDLDDFFRGQRGKSEPGGSLKGLPSIMGFRQGEALRFQKAHPLCPMGYEQFFRALGEACDRRNAQAMLITEMDDKFHVEYTVDRAAFVMRNGQRLALPGRREEQYTAAQVVALVQRSREQALDNVRRSGQTLSFNPMDVAAYLTAALALEDDGEYRNAEELFRMAAQLAPRHAETQFHLARHARRRGDRKAALKYLQQAIVLRGDDGRFFHLLGRINMERRHLDAAMCALERAVACDPENAVYHFDLSRVYERLGRTEDARAVLNGRGAALPPVDATAGVADLLALDMTSAPAPDVIAMSPARGASVTVEAHGRTPGVDAAPTLEARLEAPLNLAPSPVPSSTSATPARETPTDTPMEVSDAAFSRGPELAAAPDAWPGDMAPGLPSWEAPGTAAAPPGGSEQNADVDGLPVLGLSIAHNWATSALPALEVPADGAAAAAALPRAVPEQWAAPAPGDDVAVALPLAALDLADTAEPLMQGDVDEAVQLAAAIMRAEELTRAEPARADLHRKLGFLLAKQGRSDEAAAEFRRAVECGRRRLSE